MKGSLAGRVRCCAPSACERTAYGASAPRLPAPRLPALRLTGAHRRAPASTPTENCTFCANYARHRHTGALHAVRRLLGAAKCPQDAPTGRQPCKTTKNSLENKVFSIVEWIPRAGTLEFRAPNVSWCALPGGKPGWSGAFDEGASRWLAPRQRRRPRRICMPSSDAHPRRDPISGPERAAIHPSNSADSDPSSANRVSARVPCTRAPRPGTDPGCAARRPSIASRLSRRPYRAGS